VNLPAITTVQVLIDGKEVDTLQATSTFAVR